MSPQVCKATVRHLERAQRREICLKKSKPQILNVISSEHSDERSASRNQSRRLNYNLFERHLERAKRREICFKKSKPQIKL